MAKNQYEHLHIYRSVNAKRRLYRCIVEDCPHTMPFSLLCGRKVSCPTCEGEFIVKPEHQRRTNLTCVGCGVAPGLKKTETNPLKTMKQPTMSDLMERAKKSILGEL